MLGILVVVDVRRLFDLEPHGSDTLVGIGPRYPWGGLYGGQIVAQALRAAASSVESDFVAHSMRAYFIRRGDHNEPVRYEVDRIRNGRTFVTRRVVARQATGAILNCEASFQIPEMTRNLQTVFMPEGLPAPDDLPDSTWSPAFDRRSIPRSALSETGHLGAGRSAAWMRLSAALGDDGVLHRCWLAYLSDDLPTDAVEWALGDGDTRHSPGYSASLDHTIWFHRQPRVDQWHLHDFTCLGFVGGRGLALGQIFSADGQHVATVAQEVLSREPVEDRGAWPAD